MHLSCLTQKIEINSIIPAIRIELIKILEKNLSDAEISRKLNITKAAVSQYKHKKRGKSIKFPKIIQASIIKSANLISKGKSANAEISKLLNEMKKSKYICTICKCCEIKDFQHAKKSKDFLSECGK
jgi:predicted transcriptional regulator